MTREEATTEWISVNNGLPSEKQLVLVYTNTGTSHTYFLALWNEFIKTGNKELAIHVY